ncbi:MAG: bifunctional diaminohydroxyphosphoribosylaminopyrimidine deaminase/5-amino-6-(5-phosphoribosylamino)uracil reductase RibD [Candidatus Omnitrophota bacterium]
MHSKRDLTYLNMTLALAKKGEGKTSPNPMVGAVIVKNNRIIAAGYHRYAGGPHAEINALKKAGRNTAGATLYVSLEPCAHFGRTPPCAAAIISAGIRRVVIGMTDPHHVNNGKGVKELRRAGIKIDFANDQKPFLALNEIFIKYIKSKMPFVIVKAGQSIDGKIATKTGESKWITGEASRKYAQNLRNKVDAIMVGVNTLLIDDPFLSSRVGGKIKKEKPIKIVVDTFLKTSVNANIFKQKSPAPVIIVTTNKAAKAKVKKLEKKGAAVWYCPADKNGNIDLKSLMQELGKREISSVLVEGGGELIGSCFDQKLVDKVCFFIAPKIIGGQNAISSVSGTGIDYLRKAVKLQHMKVTQLREDIMVEALIKY